ncbi:MAG: DUF1540 domain-containing protein [Clostridia bacterium]|nr:DUF1540 domain-containing protein [Clostridia bacterium]
MSQHETSSHQCIHCTVGSCKYNNQIRHLCTLESINVCPSSKTNTSGTDESMCGSYAH